MDFKAMLQKADVSGKYQVSNVKKSDQQEKI